MKRIKNETINSNYRYNFICHSNNDYIWLGNRKTKKYLKQNEYITISQVEQICDGLEAKQPFSQNRAVVKNKQDYAKKLIEYMLKTNQIEKEGSRYKWHKK